MTVRLLKPYAGRPVNAITSSLDASTEAGLIAAGKATTDLAGGIKYFVPRSDLAIQPKIVAIGLVRLKMEEQALCTLPEGQVLLVTGAAGTVGEATRVGTSDKRVIGAGAMPPIGPFAGTHKVLITCTTGGIDAVVRDAILTAAGAAATITGTPGVNNTLTATLPAGVVGTLQWTRTTKAVPPVKSNIASAVANAVNSLTYVQQQADAGCAIGCDAANQVAPSNSIDCPVNPVTIINALSSVTLIGDSLMANGNPVVTGSGPAQGGETSVSHVGWANDTMRKAGIGIDAIQLRAVGGTTIKQHIANQLPAALTDTSRGVWCHSGVNSYNDSITTPLGGPYTQATNIADEISLIGQLAAAKDFVLVDALQPVSQAGSTGAKSRAAEFPAHNAAVKAYCDTLPNVIYLDLYSLLVDPASPQLNPLANLILVSDGIHYTTQGARLVGDYVAAQLASKLNLTRYKTAGANLLPDFSTTGGTTTPGSGTINGSAALANNWNCAITSGSAAVTLSNPVAGTLRLTISNPGGAASSIVLSALNTAALLAAVASGDTIQGGFDFATIGTSTNLTRISCAFRTNGSTGTLWNAMTRDLANEPSGDFKYNQSASSGRRWLHPRAVPAAPTAVDFLITIVVDPVGSAVVDISLPTLFKLT